MLGLIFEKLPFSNKTKDLRIMTQCTAHFLIMLYKIFDLLYYFYDFIKFARIFIYTRINQKLNHNLNLFYDHVIGDYITRIDSYNLKKLVKTNIYSFPFLSVLYSMYIKGDMKRIQKHLYLDIEPCDFDCHLEEKEQNIIVVHKKNKIYMIINDKRDDEVKNKLESLNQQKDKNTRPYLHVAFGDMNMTKYANEILKTTHFIGPGLSTRQLLGMYIIDMKTYFSILFNRMVLICLETLYQNGFNLQTLNSSLEEKEFKENELII